MTTFSVRQAANERVLQYLNRTRGSAEDDRDPRADKRDYMHAGSHPDIVERVWNALGKALPAACRRVVCGTPVLMHPQSKVLLAVAIGTQYVMRLPSRLSHDGSPAGARTEIVWSGGSRLNVRDEFGHDWIVGTFSPAEEAWCAEVFAEQQAEHNAD